MIVKIKENTMDALKNKAQKLYSTYSVLDNEFELKNKLFKICDDFYDVKDVRYTINEIIMKNYPNEAVIKAGFVDYLSKKISNKTIIYEMNVNNSRVDLCEINSKSIAYEIKTDFDTPQRLDKQIQDYKLVFDEIYLICSENKINNFLPLLPSDVGIFVYSFKKDGKIKFFKIKSSSKNTQINPQKQLETLTKQELKKNSHSTLNLEKEILINNLLLKYKKRTINQFFKSSIKQRYSNRWDFLSSNKDLILAIDYQWFYNNQINPSLIYSR